MVSRTDAGHGQEAALLVQPGAQSIFAFAGIWRLAENEPGFSFLTCDYDGDPSTHAVGRNPPKPAL
jgi:hypothetical protein